ncbi:pseudouridine synthase [uncultured Mucilaginibacter sp.]|uniref:pseudouridine synthase n=1 Tax=uncultured Mucilaginibacter sp. TaxID=797541 RepID=UPI0025F56FBA|nr:pseudouridine synthase [uncultured Mucilaginibacter sp.]
MAFKKSGNSRDDRPANSGRRSSPQGGTDNTKKSSSASRSKPSGAGYKKSESDDDRPKRKYDGEQAGEKKSFNKNFSKPGEGSSDKKYKGKPASEGKSRPYGSKTFSDGPSFKKDGGAPGKRTPYGTKTFNDAPREGGFKKEGGADSFKRKPYGTKDFSDTPREGGFKKEGGADSFKRKPYGSKDFSEKPTREGGFKKEGSGYKGKSTSDDRPARARSTGGAPKRFDKGAPKERSVRETFFDADQPQPDRSMRGRKTPTSKTQDTDKGKIRLNRYISNAGICSRRKADELIVAGVVSVNGEVISELGFKVDPYKDEVRYNGETLKREKMVYVLLNKPKDYITTTEDPQERRTVMHLVEKASKERIYPVGRLDRNTTGLLLMTNDGDLADKLSHPRNSIVKLYQVELNKSLTQGDLNKIAYGVELEDGLIKPDEVAYITGGSKREIGIKIHSGKNRVVRRIFESLGYDVVKLDRSIYAGLTKKDLPRGRWRYLNEEEIIQLKHLIK